MIKSLEIIYVLLFDFLDDTIDESATVISKGEIKQIKQDLEVLEILRKHLRFMGENKTSLKLVNNGCGSENCELYKVKQWLEYNNEE